jgi:DNA modification methylase
VGNVLVCDDNLPVLRDQVPDGSVSWVYLDPPFNSGRNWYQKPQAGRREQVLAFTDTWAWSAEAAQQYKECTSGGNPQGPALEWFRDLLGERGSLAYLAHMAVRLTELHRVLGPGGGLFLHCDPVMSHYLRILLDQVFGDRNFAAEIVWKRTGAHNNVKRGWARVHDVILAYRRSSQAAWCSADGQMILGDHGDVWDDIPPVNGAARERLGWPTQKPLRLLTRLLMLASNTGEALIDPSCVLLDPNCGCGTSLDAAQQLGLGWIGIDLSPAAIDLTASRLRSRGAAFEIRGAGRAAS